MYPPRRPIKLPSVMPDGKRTTMHPLLWCLENRMPEGMTMSNLAAAIGVKHPSLFKWLKLAREDRNFSLPFQRAVQLAAVFNVPYSLFRPDVKVPQRG